MHYPQSMCLVAETYKSKRVDLKGVGHVLLCHCSLMRMFKKRWTWDTKSWSYLKFNNQGLGKQSYLKAKWFLLSFFPIVSWFLKDKNTPPNRYHGWNVKKDGSLFIKKKNRALLISCFLHTVSRFIRSCYNSGSCPVASRKIDRKS